MRPGPHQIASGGATDGQILVWNAAAQEWAPQTPTDPALTLYDAKGDILIGTANDARARIAVGSNGQVLTADSTQSTGVKWATLTSLTDPTTTKGDLIARSSSAADRLGVGSNGQVLTADSAQTLGVKWATPGTGAVATDTIWDVKGDLAVASGADAASRLAAGSNGQVLTADSTQTLGVKWAAASGGTATYHGCSASRATNQTVVTNNALQFNVADEWDTDSIHDPVTNNTRFTIPSGMGGVWTFRTTVAWASSGTGRGFSWAKNGGAYVDIYRVFDSVSTASSMYQQSVVDINLAAGDYVECIAVVSASSTFTAARVTCQFAGTP